MKRLCVLLIALVVILCSGVVFAKKKTDIDANYSIISGTSSATITGPIGSVERIDKRTENSKVFQTGPESFTANLFNPGSKVHYKDDYTDSGEPWKDVDPEYYTDEGDHLLFSKLPYTAKIWKTKYGYEMTDKETGAVMSAELLELDDTPVALSTKKSKIDFRVEITGNGVRFWKDTKSGGAKKFKWKIKQSETKNKYKFKDEPEAYETADKEKKVEVVTTKTLIPGGFEWTEEVSKTGVTIDTDFTSEATDGIINGQSQTSWASAHATGDNRDDTSTEVRMGTRVTDLPYWGINRDFLEFDTSAIGAASTVTQVNLKLTFKVIDKTGGGRDFDIEIRPISFVVPLVDALDANWDACYAGSTDVVHSNTAGKAVDTVYTSPNMTVGDVVKDGTTQYCIIMEFDASNNSTGDGSADVYEHVYIYMSEYGTAAHRPILVVAYTTPGWAGKVLGLDGPGKVLNLEAANIGKILGNPP